MKYPKGDRVSAVATCFFLASAVIGLAFDAVHAQQTAPGNSQPDAESPQDLVADVLSPTLSHLVSRVLPWHPEAPHPRTYVSTPHKPSHRATRRTRTAPRTKRATGSPKPVRRRHAAPKRYWFTTSAFPPLLVPAYGDPMGYRVLAQGLQGRTTFKADTLPETLGFLATHGLTADHDSIRKALADGGEWRGVVGDGAGALTVHVVVDQHG